MNWNETKPGIWIKPFDGAERAFYNMSQAFIDVGKEHGSTHAVCTVRFGPSIPDPPTALRQAWQALRFECPTLSLVTDGPTKIYQQPDGMAAIEEWTDETMMVEERHKPDQVIERLHLQQLPCLYYFPRSSEVLFHSSHWRIDGIGTCMLLDRLFYLAAHPVDLSCLDWRREMYHLSPPMEDAANSPVQVDAEMDEFARNLVDKNHRHSTTGMPYKGNLSTPPGSSQGQKIVLTKDVTDALVAACRMSNISVTAAIHAALADAVFALSPGQSKDYTSIVAVNMRPHLPSPYNIQGQHPCAVYLTGINPTVQRDSTFTARTTSLTKGYRNWYSDLYLRSLRPFYQYHGEALSIRAMEARDSPPSNVTVSSLGVVDRYLSGDYGDAVQVVGFHFGCSILTRQMTLYPWTFRGELHLAVNYNEAYHDISAKDLLFRIKDVLEKELGL
ncbi:hypothetical protein SI65_03680 [Aspergillus cristatus]|uniref:Condensation domain-containing protein n=1 Tax=Aspergillus cristatus TaxID=573508 RepID=A0A1E3BI86_ASPCR|nr:hypothetical protein SI65_03680 [Aspergillus cristatus]